MFNTPNIEGIKRLIAPDYPVPEGFRCFSVTIPDDTKHLAILAAFHALIGNNWAWTGTPEERQTRSQVWREAYALTDWMECMDCEGVADCIENDELVQEALRQNLINNINNDTDVQNALQNVYNQFVGGTAMPGGVSGTNLLPDNPGCDYDKLFGSIFYTIDEMNTNNIDAFESAEAITNALERANLLMSAIPVFETLPIDEVLEYAETLWTDDIFEAYLANDTTGYRDELKCDLFCIARQRGCTLSIDDMFDYFVGRVGGDPANDLAQLIAYLVTGTWVGTQVNDVFFASQIILMKLGNQFFNLIGIRGYKTLLAIGARTPNDTWAIICDVCPETYCDDMVAGLGDMSHELSSSYPFGSWNGCTPDGTGETGGVWTAGEGETGGGAIVGVQVCPDSGSGVPVSQASVVVDLEAEFTITNVTMRYIKVATGGGGRQNIAFYDGTGAYISTVTREDFTANTWLTYDESVSVVGVRYISFNATQNEGTPKITSVCVTYEDV